jgi:alcohol dehydrogenase class IV
MVSLVHAIGHVVGGRYALQHGIAHAILLAPAMRLLVPLLGEEEKLITQAIAESAGSRQHLSAADAMAVFVNALPLPRRLRDVGVREDELDEIAGATFSDYMMSNLPRSVSQQELLGLLRDAW